MKRIIGWRKCPYCGKWNRGWGAKCWNCYQVLAGPKKGANKTHIQEELKGDSNEIQ